MTNEMGIPSPTAPEGGAETSFVRVLSGADLALCALLAGQVDLSGETQLSLEQVRRQPVPQVLLATLLTTAAGRLAGVSAVTPILDARLRFIEQAYTDEELRFVALDGAPDTSDTSDTSGALLARVRLESADGRMLAECAVRFPPR